MVQLRYFASLRETLGTGDEQVELPGDINDLSGLTRWLQNRDDTWKQALADRVKPVGTGKRELQALRDLDGVSLGGVGYGASPGGTTSLRV